MKSSLLDLGWQPSLIHKYCVWVSKLELKSHSVIEEGSGIMLLTAKTLESE